MWGCGLIGTSIGLALSGQAGRDVLLHDRDPQHVAQAVALGAGRPWDGGEPARLVVVAVPPRMTAPALREAQQLDLAQTYTHVCSVQSYVQAEVEKLSCHTSSVVGGHPLAGREVTGPQAASGDLFAGRSWAVCPSPASTPTAVSDVLALAADCGAVPWQLEPAAHDTAVALLSHLPQVVASALAAQLVPAQQAAASGASDPAADPAAEAVHQLSGPGLADTTRLAAGDPDLWTEILTANAARVGPVVLALAEELQRLGKDLAGLGDQGLGGDAAANAAEARLRELLVRGNRGRALVPVKRGEVSDAFAAVRVTVDDRPGTLAGLLSAAGAAGVNVEDVRVEHVPGRPRGVISLLVEVGAVPALSDSLAAAGWDVSGSSGPTTYT